MNLKKFVNNKLFVYFIFILVAFLTRYYLFEDRNSWHDEWHSIYVADPNISNNETMLRYYGDKGNAFLTEFYPPLNLSSKNIEAVAKIYIEKLGKDMVTLLQTTKEFAENIGVYFTAEDRTRGAEASRQAQDQGKAIVTSLAQRKEEAE